MLYDLSRLDPLTYVAVAIGVLIVAAAASTDPPRALLISIRRKFYATNSRQSMALISSRLRKCC
jgi:hypothetical protein